ncbi:hypothetical protein QL285_092459 [Trifolium repens]|nr:hypothetical protein QL285_092459 [Trifolium repens]
MENRISALENDMGYMKSTMKTLIEKIHSHSIAIGELGKQMGKKVHEPAGEESEQMQQQCVVMSELRKRIDQMILPQREEVQKVRIEIGDDSKMEKLQVKYAEKEIDSGSPQNSSELSVQKLTATHIVKPSVTKNHTTVVDVIKENNGGLKGCENESVLEVMNNAGKVMSSNELQPKLTPKPEKVVEIVTETKEVIEVKRGKNQVIVFEPIPTPELRVLEASIKTLLEPKPPDLLSPELLQSESWDSDQLAMTLPRRSPLPPEPPDVARDAVLLPSPKPPEASHTGSRGVRFTTAEGGKVLEVKGEIEGKLSNTSVIHVLTLIGELIASLNLIIIGHIDHNIISLLEKKFTIWAEEILREKAQFNNNIRPMDKEYKLLDILIQLQWFLIVNPIQFQMVHNFVELFPRDIEIRVEGQKVIIFSEYASLLGNCARRQVKGFIVKLEVDIHDREVIEIFNTYFMCVNWTFLFEIFYKREGWNLIASGDAYSDVCQWLEREKVSPKSTICFLEQQGLQREFIGALKWLSVRKGNYNFAIVLIMKNLEKLREYLLGLKAEKYTRVIIIIHHMMQPSLDRYNKGEEINVCSLRSLVDKIELLSTALVETLAQFAWIEMLMQSWNLGRMKMKVAVVLGIMCRHAFIQWDPGELNFLIATTTNDYCLGDLLIFHGWFNFVFDRGKFDGCKISTLRTRLFEGVGIDENMDQILDYVNNGPKPRLWRVYERKKGSKEKKENNMINSE